MRRSSSRSIRDTCPLALPLAPLLVAALLVTGLLLPARADAQNFIRGDANADSAVNIADVIFILNYLALGAPPAVVDAADVNDNGAVEIADPAFLLSVLFEPSSPPIPPPTGPPGPDPTPPTFPPATDPATIFVLGAVNGCPGGIARVPWRMTTTASSEGFSGRIIHSPAALTFVGNDDGALEALIGGPADYLNVGEISPGVLSVASIFRFIPSGSNGLPAGNDTLVLELLYEVSAGSSPGTVATVAFEDGAANGVDLATLLSVDGVPVVPTTVAGSVTTECPPEYFRRGDANEDGETSISDAIFLIEYLFVGGDASACQRAGDTNADDFLDISDIIALLAALFEGGPPLPAPFLVCGTEVVPGQVPCDAGAMCP